MELTIKLLNGNTFSLSVDPRTTVGQLKSKIQQNAEVPSARQRLSTQNGHRIDLKDHGKTLQDYGLHSGCIITVLIVPTVKVFLKNITGQMHAYDVSPGETVSEFKLKVQNKEQVAVQQQRLVYGSKALEDGRKLEDYDIKAGGTIQLVLRLRG
ncbi:polyubiquitin-B-like [Anguilla anguilla]|uniref:polyubiquitin-B-like n=1 Tax=Anguilla anguilla TaxID=7936 RepID=UPI0015ADF85F|nr:polyubiquitin-B-like [Anguilla anguilla]XP_035236263.1 polyubiquitin-B-like [Anguilla anguilla]